MLSLDIGPRDEPREIALADRILDEQHQTVRFVGVLRVAHQEVSPAIGFRVSCPYCTHWPIAAFPVTFRPFSASR